jgi:predicted oxidoreductase (fatty acid repression mutant protein)
MKLYVGRTTPLQEQWVRHYAWFPVLAESLSGNCSVFIWFEWVERKEAEHYAGSYWRYREVKE